MSELYETGHQKPGRTKKIFIRLIIGLLVLGVVGGATFFVFMMKVQFANFKMPSMPADVIVTPVTSLEFQDTIDVVGSTMANESTDLTASVTDRVKSISVEEGQFVPVGTVIAELNNEQEQATLNEATRAYMRYNKLSRNNLSSVAERDAAQAAMEVAQAQLNKRRIVAPFDGITGLRHVSVGDLVSPGTVVITLDQIDPIKVEFSVAGVYLPVLKEGLDITMTTPAYPNRKFTGKIYAIDSRVDEATRSISARAVLPNPDHLLRPGMLMHVAIVKSSHDAPAVPEESVMSVSGQNYVFAVSEEKQDSKEGDEQKDKTVHKVEKKVIEIGLREPGYVEILSGVKDGELVISEGTMKTGPGAEVNITEERSLKDVLSHALKFAIPRKAEALKEDASIEPSEPREPRAQKDENAEGTKQ